MKNKHSDIILFQYGDREEIGHALTHFLGILFGLFVLFQTLINKQAQTPNHLLFATCLFALGMIAVYTSSTFYHLATRPHVKLFLKKCDHASIYILIATSYTPFLLVIFHKNHSYFSLLALSLVWILSTGGVVFKLRARHKHLALSVASYFILSWLSLVLIDEMKMAFSKNILFAIFLGGFFYTFGAIFYLMKKVPYHHVVWHIFVLCGSFAHYIAIVWAIKTI